MTNRHDEATVVRRISRDEDAEHGGAWKVAFADFTLALMSLFMVLWVMSVTTPKEREQIAAQIAKSPVFDGGVGIFKQHSKKHRIIENPPIPEFGKASSSQQDGRSEIPTPPVPDSLRQLEAAVRARAAALGLQDNIETVAEQDRLKINVHDSKDRGMFLRGSDVLDPRIADLFRGLAPALAKSTDKLIIAGHTDSVRYTNAGTFENNWNLSSRRAQRVRQTLEEAGLDGEQVFEVAAMSNRLPVVPDDPTNARNRRVELLVLTDRALAQWRNQMSEPGVTLAPASGAAAVPGTAGMTAPSRGGGAGVAGAAPAVGAAARPDVVTGAAGAINAIGAASAAIRPAGATPRPE